MKIFNGRAGNQAPLIGNHRITGTGKGENDPDSIDGAVEKHYRPTGAPPKGLATFPGDLQPIIVECDFWRSHAAFNADNKPLFPAYHNLILDDDKAALLGKQPGVRIIDLTAAELKKAGVKTLDDIIHRKEEPSRPVYYFPEIKSLAKEQPTLNMAATHPDYAKKVATDYYDTIKTSGKLDHMLTISFDVGILSALADLAPDHRVGAISTLKSISELGERLGWRAIGVKTQSDVPGALKKRNIRFWDPKFRDIEKEDVDLAHSHGVQVGVWSPNEAKEIQAAVDKGVDVVTTDDPKLAFSIAHQTTLA